MTDIERLADESSGGRGHVLLVSPLTFSYHESISETLVSLGYAVTWWNDRPSNAIWYKIALRLFPSITIRLSEKAFLDRLQEIESSSISHVLVIKGEGVSRNVTEKIRKKLPSASMGLYLWDGIDNVKQAFDILPVFDSVSTFDPGDARKYGWRYRPLFWRNISLSKKAVSSPSYDWCFIGTVHSDRHRVIHRLRDRYKNIYRSFVFCYFQSPLMLLLRKLSDRTLRSAPSDSLSTKPMSAANVAALVADSKSVLDVEHPKQRGFTMRTIETLLSGKKLLTTNRAILNSDLFHSSRVCVIDRNDPEIQSGFLDEPFVEVDEKLKNYYSCSGWVSELLNFQEIAWREHQKNEVQ